MELMQLIQLISIGAGRAIRERLDKGLGWSELEASGLGGGAPAHGLSLEAHF